MLKGSRVSLEEGAAALFAFIRGELSSDDEDSIAMAEAGAALLARGLHDLYVIRVALAGEK